MSGHNCPVEGCVVGALVGVLLGYWLGPVWLLIPYPYLLPLMLYLPPFPPSLLFFCVSDLMALIKKSFEWYFARRN